MIIGSHNSWSYLPVYTWWKKPFSFMAKCQNVNIREQFEKYNVRCFDLRLRKGPNNIPVISHNYVTYEYSYGQLLDDLDWLDQRRDSLSIRVIYDIRKYSESTGENQRWFSLTCQNLSRLYPRLNFWSGRELVTWRTIYDFGTDEPDTIDKYSSIDYSNVFERVCPFLYSKKNNKNILKEYSNQIDNDKSKVLFLDFVDLK